MRKRLFVISAVVLLAAGAVGGINYCLVSDPVARELAADARNRVFDLDAHYEHYVDSSTLVLDLRDTRKAAPIDLMRGVLQAARRLHSEGQDFKKVVLARRGVPVFVMDGDDFDRFGAQFAAGENPVFLVRTLPENLRRPNGEAAFSTWDGGWLGVVGKQLEDVNAMSEEWVAGGRTE